MMYKWVVLIWFALTLMHRLPPAPEWYDPYRTAPKMPICRFCKRAAELIFGV
mgnify:CR=1 FL=1